MRFVAALGVSEPKLCESGGRARVRRELFPSATGSPPLAGYLVSTRDLIRTFNYSFFYRQHGRISVLLSGVFRATPRFMACAYANRSVHVEADLCSLQLPSRSRGGAEEKLRHAGHLHHSRRTHRYRTASYRRASASAPRPASAGGQHVRYLFSTRARRDSARHACIVHRDFMLNKSARVRPPVGPRRFFLSSARIVTRTGRINTTSARKAETPGSRDECGIRFMKRTPPVSPSRSLRNLIHTGTPALVAGSALLYGYRRRRWFENATRRRDGKIICRIGLGKCTDIQNTYLLDVSK